jgi:hypothetical protein
LLVRSVCKLVSIQQDYQRTQKIAAIKANMDPNVANPIAWENLTEDEIKQVAAVSAGQKLLKEMW